MEEVKFKVRDVKHLNYKITVIQRAIQDGMTLEQIKEALEDE